MAPPRRLPGFIRRTKSGPGSRLDVAAVESLVELIEFAGLSRLGRCSTTELRVHRRQILCQTFPFFVGEPRRAARRQAFELANDLEQLADIFSCKWRYGHPRLMGS